MEPLMFELTLIDHLRLTFGHVVYRHKAHSHLALARSLDADNDRGDPRAFRASAGGDARAPAVHPVPRVPTEKMTPTLVPTVPRATPAKDPDSCRSCRSWKKGRDMSGIRRSERP